MTSIPTTHDVNVRIAEAVGYVESCCMDGTIHVDVDPASANKWCVNTAQKGNCVNAVDGPCTNPFHPNNPSLPVTTIQRSDLTPALTWCGCANGGHPTVGYSGRCSHTMDDFYTRYEALAKKVCDAASLSSAPELGLSHSLSSA